MALDTGEPVVVPSTEERFREAILRDMVLSDLHVENGFLSAQLDIPALPGDLVFDVFAECGGLTRHVHGFRRVERDPVADRFMRFKIPVDFDAPLANLILRPNMTYAAENTLTEVAWAEDIVFRDVPVRSSPPRGTALRPSPAVPAAEPR